MSRNTLGCRVFSIPSYLFPAPSQIASVFVSDAPALMRALWVTLRVTLIALSLAVTIGLVVWYRRSPTGARIKAMVGNPELAQAVGLRTERLARNTFVVGTCLAGLAGVMVAPLTPVQPYMGLDYILKAFFVLVVGGLGSAVGLVSGAGKVWSFSPVISSSGARFSVS